MKPSINKLYASFHNIFPLSIGLSQYKSTSIILMMMMMMMMMVMMIMMVMIYFIYRGWNHNIWLRSIFCLIFAGVITFLVRVQFNAASSKSHGLAWSLSVCLGVVGIVTYTWFSVINGFSLYPFVYFRLRIIINKLYIISCGSLISGMICHCFEWHFHCSLFGLP